MRVVELCALIGVVALGAGACRSAPEESANVPAEEAVAANAAPEAAAADAAAGAAAAGETADAPSGRNERPQPETPRAEGDRRAELLASDDYLLLDVRRPDEIEELGTVEGYLNIPIEELADRLEEVPRDRPILTA